MNSFTSSEDRYAPPAPKCGAAIDLRLDANEAPRPLLAPADLASALLADTVRRYPSAAPLESILAEAFSLRANQVLVTAGADEAIDRACRAFLGTDREIIVPSPSFEMISRYARLSGGLVTEVPWTGAGFPLEQTIAAVSERTAMIAVVSPNNPTGAAITGPQLLQLSELAPRAVLLVDLAYAEFADEDLTTLALSLPNAIALRTFSKAFGLAGLRVGWVAGPAEHIARLRTTGSPFPVSGLSIALAKSAFESDPSILKESLRRCRLERADLESLLARLGARPRPSQANFVFAEFANAQWVWEALASLGISVRRFPPRRDLDAALRITCPGDEVGFDRLRAALEAILRPQAILFDMDGVLADVSHSYRSAIEQTALAFGVRVSQAHIAAAKAAGNANNDWILTHRLVRAAGVSATLEEVTDRFERLYQGDRLTPGLRERESLLISRPVLERLARRVPLGIVTGRPRSDCLRFLERFGIADLFSVQVCMEDGPPKPDSAPVRSALDKLGVRSAWLVGDTPDDIVAARAYGVVPIGFVSESHSSARPVLQQAGAAAVLGSLEELEALLP